MFEEAIKRDLEGEGGAAPAFALFLQAAKRGLPAAEFNVAVMLDSGRGVATDKAQAALWYARAASRGNPRAAFNMGQLYERGEGVPRNPDIARAWLLHSKLPAALARAATLTRGQSSARALAPPSCSEPEAGSHLAVQPDGVELVWVSGEQPEPVRFFVEVRDGQGVEVFTGYSSVTSTLVPLPARGGKYVWRVSAIAATQGRYLACDWSDFTLDAE